MKQYITAAAENGMKISRFVEMATRGFPNALLRKAFRNRRIKINGKRAQMGDVLHTGDVVELYLNDEYFPNTQGQGPAALTPSKAPLEIVYEDEHIAILHKPAGLLSHPGERGGENLLDSFVQYLAEKKEYRPQAESPFRPALCNRLDRNTEGLLIAAKSYSALTAMNALIHDRLVTKQYRCICLGQVVGGEYRAWLSRDRQAKQVLVSGQPLPGGKPIATRITRLEEKNGLSLCSVELVTGRTHQIRAHLAYLGWPLLGDGKYGAPAQNRKYSASFQCLCSHSLRFSPQIPEAALFAYLGGKCFTASHCEVDSFWARLP